MGNKAKTDGSWGYKTSFIIGTTILLLGILLQVVLGDAVSLSLQWPYNLVVLGIHIVGCVACFVCFKNTRWVRWLTRVPASMVSILLLLLVTMLLGTIPQQPIANSAIIRELGLHTITQTWYFLGIIFFFSTCLLMVSIKRVAYNFKANLGFLANHLGLYLALIAGVLGSGDLIRYTMELKENKIAWVATDGDNKAVVMPIAIVLEDFVMEEFAPKLALINSKGELLTQKGRNLYLVKEGLQVALEKDYEVEVVQYLPDAVLFNDVYKPVNQEGATSAVFVKVTNKKTGLKKTGWLASGTFLYDQQSLPLDNHHYLVLTRPEPKKFSSKIKIFTVDKKEYSTVLEVNKPFEVMGWRLYQLSYNERFGKYSSTSTIELVKDPWLPLVYLGVFMMIGGSVYLFFIGNVKTKTND